MNWGFYIQGTFRFTASAGQIPTVGGAVSQHLLFGEMSHVVMLLSRCPYWGNVIYRKVKGFKKGCRKRDEDWMRRENGAMESEWASEGAREECEGRAPIKIKT